MPESQLQSRSLIVDGVATPLLEGGAADSGEAIVFIHGNPGAGRDWERLAGEASAFARVVAPDMPGFGRADKPADFSYTIDGYAQHLDSLLRALAIHRAHLVLHDFGGPWGLRWATDHADAVASLTLINTGVMLRYRWHSLARVWRTPLLGELFQATATRAAFHGLLKRGNPRRLPREFVDRMYDDYDAGTKRAVLRLYRATSRPAKLSEAMAPALRRLQVPVLVVWGRHDPYIGIEVAERQREVFPEASLVVLDDSGHWPFADNPAATSAEVVPFLRRHFRVR